MECLRSYFKVHFKANLDVIQNIYLMLFKVCKTKHDLLTNAFKHDITVSLFGD